MLIPTNQVEPGDLVRVSVDDELVIEFRAALTSPVRRRQGRTLVVAYATPPAVAAIMPPNDLVELVARADDRQHPHGWSSASPDSDELHYFDDGDALCRAVIGYFGLCYPVVPLTYFPRPTRWCAECARIRERSASELHHQHAAETGGA